MQCVVLWYAPAETADPEMLDSVINVSELESVSEKAYRRVEVLHYGKNI